MAFTYNKFTLSDAAKKHQEEAEKYKTYVDPQHVVEAKNLYDTLKANPIADWTGGNYGASRQEVSDRINNREKFVYDLNGDALYQQYKDLYINQGRMAMQDTMGQAAAMTGGYGNSYATTAGNQAYQGYLQQLNNVVPELYNLALNKYNMEGQQLKDQFDMLNQLYNSEYGEHRDTVSDYNTKLDRLANDYYNLSQIAHSDFNADREYYTNLANTRYNREYGEWYDQTDLDFAIDQQQEKAAQAAAQTEATYRAAGYTKDKDGNWVAPAAKGEKYFLDDDQKNLYMSYIDNEEYDDAIDFLERMRNKGMTDDQMAYWLEWLPPGYERGNNGGTTPNLDGLKSTIKRFFGFE